MLYICLTYNEYLKNKQVQCNNGPLVLRSTSQTVKIKNPPTYTPRVFGSITQNRMIFFVTSTEANNQLETSYSFQFF